MAARRCGVYAATRVLCFGGIGLDNRIWSLETADALWGWQPLRQNGTAPPAGLVKFAAAIYRDSFVVFGGIRSDHLVRVGRCNFR